MTRPASPFVVAALLLAHAARYTSVHAEICRVFHHPAIATSFLHEAAPVLLIGAPRGITRTLLPCLSGRAQVVAGPVYGHARGRV